MSCWSQGKTETERAHCNFILFPKTRNNCHLLDILQLSAANPMSISCIEHNYPLLERITDFCRGTEVRKFKWVSGGLTKALRGNHFQWKSMKCTSDTHPSLFNFSIVGPDLLPAFSLTMFVSQVQFSILYSKVSSSGNLHKHYSLSKHRCQCIGNN